jgi:uncharacterized phage-associated protein
MFHLGEYETPIFTEDFEAWELGPVLPDVYQRAKIYGSAPVENLFTNLRLPDGTGKQMIHRVLSELPDRRPWKLVSITHWDQGAWAKHYADNQFDCVIPKADILDEYRARARRKQHQAVAG